jgi:hypothetical protein
MRAKFIYEAFEETSDPIKDMGIGDDALSQLCDQFFDSLRADPAAFPWNCYFLIENGNEVGFLYKYGDRMYMYSYFKTPEDITEIEDYTPLIKRTGIDLKRIPKDILRKTETFQRNDRNASKLNYDERIHPLIVNNKIP